jgi:hypothetical protein
MNYHFPSSGTIEYGRLVTIARELSAYGLAITAPHMHCMDGTVSTLPSGMLSYEKNLKTSFLAASETKKFDIPVSWRWNGSDLEVCAACCGDYDPPDPTIDN